MNGYPTPRLRRQYVFLMGLLSGMALTASAFFLTAATVKPEPAPGWNRSAIVGSGLHDGRWYAKNTTSRDCTLVPDGVRIFGLDGHGLTPTSARLAAPAFIPAGEAAALEINPLPAGDLVIFDHARRYRLDLRKGGGQ